MAITIVNQWPGTAGDQDKEIIASSTPGRTLVAVIVSRVVDGSAPTLAIGDVSRNGWTLLSDPVQFASSAHAAAQLQCEVWACPAVRYDGWPFHLIYASATQITASDVGSLCVNVIEVNGLLNQLAVESVTLNTATTSTTLALTAPAPVGAANCLFVAAAVSDIAYGSYTTSAGWTQLPNLTTTNPNVGLLHAWREATTGATCTFTLGLAQNWAGVVVALRTAGVTPAQPNPAWPATSLQIGLGYDLSTPLSRVRWTDQTTRYRSMDGGDRGIQAERGTAQQANATIGIRDDDGAYTPRTVVALAASATAAGTTTTIKVADASATSIHVTDFFRLKTAAGVLKQLDVFQVTGLASAAGTTTITFKRADGTAGGALASTASGDIYAGIQIDLYIPWRLQKTVGGTTYTPGSGWLRDLPIAFSDAHWAEVNAAGADALEALSGASNPSALRGEIYRRTSLYAYWPLDDSSGSGYAANASGVSNAALTQTVSKYGKGTSTTADFGASTQDLTISTGVTSTTSFLGDQSTGWAQDGQTSAELSTKGYALVGSDPGMPSIADGVTVFGFMVTTQAQDNVILSATADPTVCILRNTDPAAGVGQGSVIKISIARAGTAWPIITRWDKTTHAATATTTSTLFFGGAWNFWALTFNQTSWAFYLDGFLCGSGSCNLVASWSGIDIGGEADPFWHGRTLPGTHAHVGVYSRRLSAGEIQRISNAGEFAYYKATGETASARIQKKLAAAGWKNTRVLNPGPASLSPETAPSGSVADSASDTAGQEDSLVFADSGNQLQYRSRVTAYQQFPRAILGDDTGSGEIPYQPGQLFSFEPTYIYNDVEVENANLSNTNNFSLLTASKLIAIDDISAARYGTRTMTLATRYLNNYNAWDIAWWYLARYAYPRMRVGSVTISAIASNDTASSTGRWAFVCGVEVGDLVTVNRRPIGQPMISVRCRVLSVQPSFKRDDGSVTGQVTLTLGAAPPLVPIANDTTYGVIGGTVVGA